MSGPRTMTAAEYLTARGWIGPGEWWSDHLYVGLSTNEPQIIEHALTVQRARDEADERKAWVAFAAAAMLTEQHLTIAQHFEDKVGIHGKFKAGGDDYTPAFSADAASECADAMLDEYRARFAVEVKS